MAIVSRLQLDHPALGAAGGASLHTSIQAIYQKLGDNLADRYFTVTALADTANTDLEHNFKTAFDDLRVDLYLWNTGTGELTQITAASTPNIGQFTIAATPGFLTTKLRVTNNSGASRDLVVVALHDPISLGELENVTLSSPQRWQVPAYNPSTSKWENGYPFPVNRVVGPSDQYTTLSAALAAASPGDIIYVNGNVTETADLSIAVSGVWIIFRRNAMVTFTGSGHANLVNISASNVKIDGGWFNYQGTVTNPAAYLYVNGGDCIVNGLVLNVNAVGRTITYPVSLTGLAARSWIQVARRVDAGTMGNSINDASVTSRVELLG